MGAVVHYLSYTPGLQIGDFYGEPEMTFRARWSQDEDDYGRSFWACDAVFDCFMLDKKLIRRPDLVEISGEAEVRGVEERASRHFEESADEYMDAA